MTKNVIARTLIVAILMAGMTPIGTAAQTELEEKIDSLFIIASSGEVRYRDQNEPAMDSIAALGAAAVPHLIDKFTTKSARERWTVIWTLERIGSAAVPDLNEALQGDNPLVVQRVAWALGRIKDTAAVGPLVAVVEHDSWQVRDQSVTALGKIGDPRGALPVINALSDTVPQVRKSAAVAYGRLGIQMSPGELVHLLGDEFYGARWAAAHALLTLDTVEAITVVRDSIGSDNAMLGDIACWVLGEIATNEAVNMLWEQVEAGSPARRAHAAVALVRADPDNSYGYHEQLLANETDRLVALKIQSAIEAASNEPR